MKALLSCKLLFIHHSVIQLASSAQEGQPLASMATHTQIGPEPINEVSVPDIEKVAGNEKNNEITEEDLKDLSDDEFKQQGVKKAEAMTTVWSKKMLIATFIL